MNAPVALLKALYAPAPVPTVPNLHELADSLQRQLIALSDDPSPQQCEAVAGNLDGARRAVLRIREQLMARGVSHG